MEDCKACCRRGRAGYGALRRDTSRVGAEVLSEEGMAALTDSATDRDDGPIVGGAEPAEFEPSP